MGANAIETVEMVKTLIKVVVLVFLFLQSWRATLIPTSAVPVVLLGPFDVMAAASAGSAAPLKAPQTATHVRSVNSCATMCSRSFLMPPSLF